MGELNMPILKYFICLFIDLRFFKSILIGQTIIIMYIFLICNFLFMEICGY